MEHALKHCLSSLHRKLLKDLQIIHKDKHSVSINIWFILKILHNSFSSLYEIYTPSLIYHILP